MKTQTLLFALICGALNAAEPDIGKITFAGDAGVLAGPFIGSYTNGDKNGYPTEKSDFNFTAIHAAHVKIDGHIIIATEEAADVVRAMEILEEGMTGSFGFIPTPDTPESGIARGLRVTRNQKLMREHIKKEDWARSILELWKKKLEGAK